MIEQLRVNELQENI